MSLRWSFSGKVQVKYAYAHYTAGEQFSGMLPV
jgi:hypothetical protein